MSDAPAEAGSRRRRGPRGRRSAGASEAREAPPRAAAPKLDEETAAALTLYNTYLVADRESQQHDKALRRAERAKDEAAAEVRKLNERNATGEESAAAEAAYREAVDALQRLRDGNTRPPPTEPDPESPDASDPEASDSTNH